MILRSSKPKSAIRAVINFQKLTVCALIIAMVSAVVLTQPVRPVHASASMRRAKLSAGGGHTCAVAIDGSAKCWGRNNEGELGDGTAQPNRLTPVSVVNLTSGVVADAAVARFALPCRAVQVACIWTCQRNC